MGGFGGGEINSNLVLRGPRIEGIGVSSGIKKYSSRRPPMFKDSEAQRTPGHWRTYG